MGTKGTDDIYTKEWWRQTQRYGTTRRVAMPVVNCRQADPSTQEPLARVRVPAPTILLLRSDCERKQPSARPLAFIMERQTTPAPVNVESTEGIFAVSPVE